MKQIPHAPQKVEQPARLARVELYSLPVTQSHIPGKQINYRRRGQLYQRWSLVLTYAILLVVCLIIFVPFVWLLSASLKTNSQYFASPIQWIPQPFVWQNYVEVFTAYNFAHYIFNSVWLAAYATTMSTLVSALVAYGFARFRFPGRNIWFIVLLATMMLPTQVLTISLYRIFRDLNWIDTFLPIMVPQLFGSAFSVFLFRQFFINLPRELDDAASIDGCGKLRIFWSIILPQSKPVLVVVAIFTFLASWRDAWSPLIYLNSDANRTVPLGLFFFTSAYQTFYPQLMAATVIALVVPVILYALGQRYIDSGVAIAEVR